jgi:energy-coupling factor transporter ATP-binding protein EcfA2
MKPARIALIGHSGAGKSSYLSHRGIDPHAADMDTALGVDCSPPLEQALAWMTEGAEGQAVVVVSNHEEMLEAMHQAKRTGRHAESFACVRLVYLRKPKDRLARHLGRPTAAGDPRDDACRRYTLGSYERLDKMFSEMADDVIDCGSKSIEEVAAEVNALVRNSRQESS